MDTLPCFVCEPDYPRSEEAPGRWNAPRQACALHFESARLADGERLFARLERLGIVGEVLDGSIIGRALGPAWIEDATGRSHKAWAAFASGGAFLFEDRFDAQDLFEVGLLDNDDGCDLLFVLRHREPIPTQASIGLQPYEAILQAIVAAGPIPAAKRVSQTLATATWHWNEQRRIRAWIVSVGALDTTSRLARFRDEIVDNSRYAQLPDDRAAFDFQLFQLAWRRFPRLPATTGRAATSG